MLLTITCNGTNAQYLSYLLYKNPYRPQGFDLSFGKAYVFYPEISDNKATAALLLDINPLDLTRGKEGAKTNGLFDYVNDRPYVSSSFMSVAISSVFRTAMNGRAAEHQEIADRQLDLEAVITMLPCRGDESLLARMFEPLGYSVDCSTFDLDEKFPDWGKSFYVNLKICGKVRLCDLLRHIYILLPVFDKQKHYWVGSEEITKLFQNGGDWLANHPEKEYIIRNYFKNIKSLVNKANALITRDQDQEENHDNLQKNEKKRDLNNIRLCEIVEVLKKTGAKSVIDIGCGEGNLIHMIYMDVLMTGINQFDRIAGTDVSISALNRAKEMLKSNANWIKEPAILFQSSLTYKDIRFKGYDAVCLIEVIEHLDSDRLIALEHIIFEYAKYKNVIITTPNREYNSKYEHLKEGELRHLDHRFEWTRNEFCEWAQITASKYGYTVSFSEIGEIDTLLGGSTQMGVFTCN